MHYLLLEVGPESPRPLGLAPQNNLCSSWRDIRPIIDMTVGGGGQIQAYSGLSLVSILNFKIKSRRQTTRIIKATLSRINLSRIHVLAIDVCTYGYL